MVGLFVSFAVGAGAGFYVGAKYKAADLKAELVKIENSVVADAKTVIAAIRARL